jgi:hypothetical protein
MRILKLIATAIFMGSVAHAELCDDPLRQKDICMEMKHLRSQILVLGAQRDLLQVNYPYLQQIGIEMQGLSSRVKDRIINSDPEHATGLVGVEKLANELVGLSADKKAEALVISNNIQKQCANCHSKENPSSDIKWDDIFKNDWSVFYAKCNQQDRNPYTCKSMHGMLSSISTFFTASQLGLQNYEITKLGALEIERISQDLSQKQFLHGGEIALSLIELKAKNIAELAEQKNPEAFNKAVAITQVCMQCHSDRPDLLNKKLSYKKL